MNDDYGKLPCDLCDKEDEDACNERIKESLKPDINAFLWSHLPGYTTIQKADKVASAIHDLIMREFGAN